MKHLNVQVNIQVDGEDVPEYGYTQDGTVHSCFIEAKTGKEFKFHLKTQHFDIDASYISFDCKVDGIWVIGALLKETNGRICSTDSKQNLVLSEAIVLPQTEDDNSDCGCISVKCGYVQEMYSYMSKPSEIRLTDVTPKSDVKKNLITHRVQANGVASLQEKEYVKCDHLEDICTFKFFYRSEMVLMSDNLKPPPEGLKLEDMSRDEISESILQHLLRHTVRKRKAITCHNILNKRTCYPERTLGNGCIEVDLTVDISDVNNDDNVASGSTNNAFPTQF